MLRQIPQPYDLARKVGITPNDLALLRLTNDVNDLGYFRSADGARRYLRMASVTDQGVTVVSWYEIVPPVADVGTVAPTAPAAPKEKTKGKK